MRMTLAVALTLTLVLVSSCTSPAGIVGESSKLYFSDPDAATVTVMRKSQLTGAAITVKLSLDADVIAHLGTGDRVEFQVLPGEHYVAIDSNSGSEEVIRFNAEARKKYYFHYSVDMYGDEVFMLRQLTQEEGEKELAKKKYKLLTPGK